MRCNRTKRSRCPRLSWFFAALFCFSVQLPAAQLPQSAIASAHPLATQAGFEILDKGGNAFDAAVAVSAALAVVEPMSSGIGGGGFWLLHRASDGFQTMVDGREKAPLAARKNLYQDDQGKVVPDLSMNGPLAAGIPGSVAALVHIAKHYGKLPLAQSLAPAIRYAREGFKTGEAYQRMASFRQKAFLASPDAAAIFLKDNAAPKPGSLIVQLDLANTLEQVAQHGHAGFYQGALAQALVTGVTQGGGIWRLEDLANYRVEERQPVIGRYRGLTITSAAPPSSGGIAIMTMLNILQAYDLQHLKSSARTHLLVEAMRRAYRDRAVYLGDPDYVSIPQQQLTDPDYAMGLRASIRRDRATLSENLPGVEMPTQAQDTTHFSIVDRDGNRVAATLSINYPFGACFVPPGTGVLLNDEMDDFAAKPGVPNAYGLVGADANAIAPGKRPLSSMSPTFVDSEHGFAVIGTPGGSRIITMVLQGILDYADGQNAQQIVSNPRFHHQFLPDTVFYEEGRFNADEQSDLSELGHQLQVTRWKYGNMQAVVWDKQGNSLQAASDPRGEGAAIVR